VGYGPATALTSSEVREIAAELGRVTHDNLWARYSPEEMDEAGVYPSVWSHDPAEETREWLLSAFDSLREFVAVTSRSGSGLLVRII
jgi:hypothetical protein